MNTYQRLLAAILIALSCLFAIQPAGAVNAQENASGDGLCGITEPLPENFPTWLEMQLRADDDCTAEGDDANLVASNASLQPLCVNNAPLPDYVPTWIVVRELANDDCFVEADTNLMGSGETNVQNLRKDLPGEIGPTV